MKLLVTTRDGQYYCLRWGHNLRAFLRRRSWRYGDPKDRIIAIATIIAEKVGKGLTKWDLGFSCLPRAIEAIDHFPIKCQAPKNIGDIIFEIDGIHRGRE